MDGEKIYHYTNLESLKNMLEYKSLWATNCEYLNDLLEQKTLENEFDEIFDVNDEAISLYAKNIITNSLTKLRKLTYIISFTEDNDSIAMWRNYGNNGIVLEFDASEMVNIAKQNVINIIGRDNKNIKLSTCNIYRYAIYDDLLLKDLFEFLFKTARNEYKVAPNRKKIKYLLNINLKQLWRFIVHILLRRIKTLVLRRNLEWYLLLMRMILGRLKNSR
jgi:hypothetical protein